MHLLAREEMGLRCLLRVALEEGVGGERAPVPIARIAESEGISAVYAAKLMRRLRLGKLVDSTRGVAGGYHLTRPAGEITVWDAIGALDESFLPAANCDCEPIDRADCRRTTDCAISSLWRRLGSEIKQQLSETTLFELCGGTLDAHLSHAPMSPHKLPVMNSAGTSNRAAHKSPHPPHERTAPWPS